MDWQENIALKRYWRENLGSGRRQLWHKKQNVQSSSITRRGMRLAGQSVNCVENMQKKTFFYKSDAFWPVMSFHSDSVLFCFVFFFQRIFLKLNFQMHFVSLQLSNSNLQQQNIVNVLFSCWLTLLIENHIQTLWNISLIQSHIYSYKNQLICMIILIQYTTIGEQDCLNNPLFVQFSERPIPEHLNYGLV